MHPNNIHHIDYDFDTLILSHQELSNFVFTNIHGKKSIDFSDAVSVFHLNKAILIHHYQLTNWEIPENYLCPPIPGRADYIHHIADLLADDGLDSNIKGLDIGVGANCIYPILGAQIYNWDMVGVDINMEAIASAKANVNATENLKQHIEIKHQADHANIFYGIIGADEYFHFSMCNPPFHASKNDAAKAALRKLRNLKKTSHLELNFGGQAQELWCNGGEALFIKRMIKQSVAYKAQIGWFSCLISKKENLQKIYKQLDKLKAVHKTILMQQGNKKSRFIAWKFE